MQKIFERYGKVKEVHIDGGQRKHDRPKCRGAIAVGRGCMYNYAMVTFFDGGERRRRRLRLSTAPPSRTSVSPTSESLEVNFYSARACGGGGTLSDDDIDSDDDDEFNSALAYDAYDDAYM